MQNFALFFRALQTAFGLFGMLIALSGMHKDYKIRCGLFAIVIFVCCGLLTATYMLTSKLVIVSIWFPLLFVVMLWGLFYVATDRWQVILFNFFTQLNVYLMISYFAKVLTLFLTNNSTVYYLIFRTILFAGVIYLEYRFVRKPFRRMANIVKNEWNFAIVVSVLFLIIILFLSTYPLMYSSLSTYEYTLVALAFLLMMSIYYCFYIILYNVILRYEKLQTDSVISLKLSSLERQIEMQKQTTENIRRTRHDLRHNCMVVMGQISSKDYDGAFDFLKQFTDDVELYMIVNHCLNKSVNCILSALSERAEKLDISVEIKANVPEKLLAISDVELASLFANAFENAIEGCMRVESIPRSIQISADYIDNRILLSVKNSCDKVDFLDGLPVSNKIGGGTGTKSITYITEKYNGMANFEVLNNMFIMQAYLLDE